MEKSIKGQTFTIPAGANGFTCTNKSAITLAKNGKVTARATGNAEIKNASGETVYSITVVDPAPSNKKLNLVPGKETELSISGLSGGEDLGKAYPVLWMSENPSIARVEQTESDARVIAEAKGSTNVVAYINGKAYKANVKVNATENTNLTGSVSDLGLAPLQSITLKLRGASFKNAEWTSTREMKSDGVGAKRVFYDGVVHITAAGKITAVGAGTTKLTCTTNGVEINVTVKEPATRNLYITAGKKQTVAYQGVKNNDAKWECGETNAIDRTAFETNGTIKALAAGKVSTSCFYDPYGDMGDGFNYKTDVYVENPALQVTDGLVKKNQYTYEKTMSAGSEYQLKFEDNAQYKVYQPVIFTSSKPQAAYADENGMVHVLSGAKRGNVTLTGAINGKKMKVVVKVS